MEKKILNTISRIKKCNDLSTFKEILIHIKEDIGFKHILYATEQTETFNEGRTFIVTDYPKKWVSSYIKNKYINIDPAILHCSKNQTPYCWGYSFGDDKPNEIEKEKIKYNLMGGVSIGIPNFSEGTSYYSVATNHVVKQGGNQCLRTSLYIMSVHPYLNEVFIKLTKKKSERYKLTRRELECLGLIASGKTSNEISVELSISNDTVIFHLKNVIRKLNVKNRTQAVAEAILSGVIHPHLSLSRLSKTYQF